MLRTGVKVCKGTCYYVKGYPLLSVADCTPGLTVVFLLAVVDHLQRRQAEHPVGGPLHVHVGPALPAGDAGGRRRRLRDVDAARAAGAAGGRGQVRVPDQHQAREEQARLPQGRR